MRTVYLVAMREFLENAATKGFWIGILLFPLMILASLYATRFLEKATPTRQFVLVDQSGELEKVIVEGLEREHQGQVLEALIGYSQKHSKILQASVADIDLEKMPAEGIEEHVKRLLESNPEVLDGFIAKSGLQPALDELKPLLKDDAPAFEEPRRRFVRVDLPAGVRADQDVDDLVKELRSYLKGDSSLEHEGRKVELFAAILIPKDVLAHVQRPGLKSLLANLQRQGIQYWASNLADKDLKSSVERVVNDEIRRREFLGQKLDIDKVRAVQATRVPFASLNPKKAEGKEEVSIADVIRQWAPVGFVYLLWIAIFTISQMLLNNTIEEKSNRIIEVLLSSITPGELMMGKLAGIAAVGLTVTGSWILSLVLILKLRAGPESQFAVRLFEVLQTSNLLPAFCVYFLLGYLLYAGIFLAIGSVCNTLKEAQNMMGPVMMILIVPLFTMMFIPKDPNGTLATVLTWIPLYTPFIMMNRAAADPPWFDMIGSLILLVLFTAFVLWMSGRIFRIGILRTGQPPKLLELLRWIKA